MYPTEKCVEITAGIDDAAPAPRGSSDRALAGAAMPRCPMSRLYTCIASRPVVLDRGCRTRSSGARCEARHPSPASAPFPRAPPPRSRAAGRPRAESSAWPSPLPPPPTYTPTPDSARRAKCARSAPKSTSPSASNGVMLMTNALGVPRSEGPIHGPCWSGASATSTGTSAMTESRIQYARSTGSPYFRLTIG